MNKNFFTTSHRRVMAVAILALFLGGCAGFSQDGGFATIEQTAKERIGKDVTWARNDREHDTIEARVTELLKKPLSADDAVQIALLNNKGLQASFFELGIAESDLVQAGRLPNPGFSSVRARAGDEFTIEQALTFNIFSLLTLPQSVAMEKRRFEQTQRLIAMEVLSLAAQTRKAYIMAVSADETLRYTRQVKDVADAGAELARRMARVGNWNKLSQAREQGFYADAALNLARAAQTQTAAREKLTRLLGLWGEQAAFSLPERLPDLPRTPDDLPNIEQIALEQRTDLQAMRLEIEALAKNLGLVRTTRFINVLEFGPVRIKEGVSPDPYRKGYELRFEIPLFDWGTARVAKAEAIYMQAVNRLAESAVNARSEVREAYRDYRASYDIARHYRDEIVPIKKLISDENLLRYNGMLLGAFDLLADARSQIMSVNGYIESLRDFWLAQADLDMAMIGKTVTGASPKAGMVVSEANAGH